MSPRSRFRGPKPIIVDDDPDNPLGLPPVRWWWCPNETKVHRRLRGGAAFELARQCGIDVVDWSTVRVTGEKIQPNRYRHRMFVGNPGDQRLVDMFRRLRRWRKPPRVVVDVTFSIAEMEGLISTLPTDDPRYEDDARFVRDYWARHLPNLIDMIKIADAVTTVHPEWASPLTLLSDRVEVLPDLTDEVQAPAFLATVARLFGDEGLVR